MTTSELRLLRGGSWLFYPWSLRSAVRSLNPTPYSRNRNIGLRLALLDTEGRSARGGSWNPSLWDPCSGHRIKDYPSDRVNDIGFRIALTNSIAV